MSRDRSGDRKVYKTLYCDYVAETDLAVLYDLEDIGEHWIPKSVINDEGVAIYDTLEVQIEVWFLEREGLT